MRHCPRARWQFWLLLIVLFSAAAVPRAFVVCVSRGDHCSLETDFEAVPCEADFIFGAGTHGSWPPADCTDAPAVQLLARTDAPEFHVVVAPFAIAPRPTTMPSAPFRHPTDGREGPRAAPTAFRAFRTIVLRI